MYCVQSGPTTDDCQYSKHKNPLLHVDSILQVDSSKMSKIGTRKVQIRYTFHGGSCTANGDVMAVLQPFTYKMNLILSSASSILHQFMCT